MHTDQVRKVDAAVRNLLGGMDRVQFCQAVLLAQNRYAELLEVDERKRLELLDILLGLTALADARKAFHTTDKAVQRNIERLQDRRTDLPVDPAATAKEAADRSTAMAQLAERARAGADTLKALVEKAADLTGQVRALEEAAALRIAGADGYERLVALGTTSRTSSRPKSASAARSTQRRRPRTARPQPSIGPRRSSRPPRRNTGRPEAMTWSPSSWRSSGACCTTSSNRSASGPRPTRPSSF